MKNQFARLAAPFERVPAIDATSVSTHPFQNHLTSDALKVLSPKELGCLFSHCEAWQRLIDSGDDCAAVFEDDVHLYSPIRHLQNIDRIQLTGPWIVKLETFLTPTRIFHNYITRNVHGFAIVRLADNHQGSAAYIISKQAAKALLSQRIPGTPLDALLFDVNVPARTTRAYQAVPALAVQDFLVAHAGPRLHSTIDDRKDGKVFVPANIYERVRRWIFQRIVRPVFSRPVPSIPIFDDNPTNDRAAE